MTINWVDILVIPSCIFCQQFYIFTVQCIWNVTLYYWPFAMPHCTLHIPTSTRRNSTKYVRLVRNSTAILLPATIPILCRAILAESSTPVQLSYLPDCTGTYYKCRKVPSLCFQRLNELILQQQRLISKVLIFVLRVQLVCHELSFCVRVAIAQFESCHKYLFYLVGTP